MSISDSSWLEEGWTGHTERDWGRLKALTICRTSAETICMQHMAVAKAHTMVERTLRAQTLKRRSCRKRRRRRVSSHTDTESRAQLCKPGSGTAWARQPDAS